MNISFSNPRFVGLATILVLAGASQADADPMHASATIEVTDYQEQPYGAAIKDGSNLFELMIQEKFSGDIDAIGTVRFLQARVAGSASFVGMEQVSGSIGGRKGTFVLQDTGAVKGDDVSGTWIVVPGSGTGDLKGLRGSGGFKAKLGQRADVTLDYSFE